jgi:hypothetical protein
MPAMQACGWSPDDPVNEYRHSAFRLQARVQSGVESNGGIGCADGAILECFITSAVAETQTMMKRNLLLLITIAVFLLGYAFASTRVWCVC